MVQQKYNFSLNVVKIQWIEPLYLVSDTSKGIKVEKNLLDPPKALTEPSPSTLATTNRPLYTGGHVVDDDTMKNEIKSGS